MLAVVALGIFMGKYMFKLMELKSTQNNQSTSNSTTTSLNTNNQESSLHLYKDNSGNASESISSEDIKSVQNTQTPKALNPTNNASASASSDSINSDSQNPKPANDTLAFSPTGPRWYAYATTNGLNVRETPDKKGKFMFKVAKGTRGVVKEKKDGWTYIQWDFNKKKGWSIDDYLIQGPSNIVDNIVTKSSNEKTDKTNIEKITQASIEKELEQSKTIIAVARPASLTETVITYTNGKELPKNGIISPPNGSSFANIREAPNTQCKKIAKLPKGSTVGIKSVKQIKQHQWFEITFSNNSKSGWTRDDNLKF